MPSLISKLGFPGNRPGAVAETAGGPFMTLADDTLIPTPQGWTALGDITIGQQAFDDRTQPPADEPEVARGTPGVQAALCVALFSLLFAVVWVFVVWYEVFENTADSLAACPRINFRSVYRHNIPEYVLNTK